MKGLNGTEDGSPEIEDDEENPLKETYNHTVPNTGTRRKNDISKTKTASPNSLFASQTNPGDQIFTSMAVSIHKHELSGDMKELDEQIKNFMCRGENMIRHGAKKETAYVCKVCGKKNRKHNIRAHIEANHLEGISFLATYVRKISGKDIHSGNTNLLL